MSLSVVLPGEGDVAVLDGKNAVIGEGDAVGVSGEVAQDLFGPAEGGLGVDDPFAAAGVIEQSGEGGRICQVTARSSRKTRRKRRESTRTGRKKFFLQAIQRLRSADRPPAGTTQ